MSPAVRNVSQRAASLLLALAVCLAIAPPVPAAAASGVPYQDSQSIGFITLYDKAGNPVRGGGVLDKPFVWRAVSSHAAPAPYNGAGRKATLLAYQPRQGAAPALWSGDTLTASTGYPDAAHPTAQATATDFRLKDYLDGFPPSWDGLVELRIYFGVPGQPTLTASYVSTDIRVAGQSWSVVGGGPGAGEGGANIPGRAPSGAATPGGTDTPSGSAQLAASGTLLPGLGTPATLAIAAVLIVALVLGGLLWRRRRAPGQGRP